VRTETDAAWPGAAPDTVYWILDGIHRSIVAWHSGLRWIDADVRHGRGQPKQRIRVPLAHLHAARTADEVSPARLRECLERTGTGDIAPTILVAPMAVPRDRVALPSIPSLYDALRPAITRTEAELRRDAH
jgi:hypothetical protein